jgi:hypothetical protein
MAKADGAVGLNLDIEPRHYTAGAEATRKRHARDKREKLAKGDVIIRPEHRLAGAKNANRAKERAKAEEDCETRPERAKPVLAPFARSGEAFQMLLSIFGYPTAKLEPAKGKVHRLGLPDEDKDDAPKVPQQQKRRPGYEHRYRMLEGVEQKQCRDCEQWFDLNADHFRYKIDAYKACWSTYCHPCERVRRQAAWRKRYQKMKARVMV